MAVLVGPGPRRALLDAVRAVLRPLVRQMIAFGITYPAFSRLAKEVYIEVGTRHFTLDYKKQTDSRVALVTGITRKEIGQIRRGQALPPGERGARSGTLAARVVGRWIAGPPYTADDRTPYVLPYEAVDRASFAALVGEVGGDIPARAVLDELLRVGAAALTPRGSVRLIERGIQVPAADFEERIAKLGGDAADLIEGTLGDLERGE